MDDGWMVDGGPIRHARVCVLVCVRARACALACPWSAGSWLDSWSKVCASGRATCALKQKLPLCKSALLCSTSCLLLLCTQVIEERFDGLVKGLLTPLPIGAEGSWKVPDALDSAKVTVLCMLSDSAAG